MSRPSGRFVCGLIIIAVGASVVLALWLPPPWLVVILGLVLVWAGLKLLC